MKISPTKGVYLSILSGILLFLSFPRYDLGFVVWVALVPLLIAIRGQGLKRSFLLGYLTGIVYYLGTIHWVTNSMILYGNLPSSLSYLIMSLFVLYLGLYIGIFSLLINYIGGRKGLYIFIYPAIWTSLEFARAHLLTGFPWASMAYSQYRYTVMIQVADITSIYGISFLIVMVNTLIALLISRERGMLIPTIMTLSILILSSGYGVWRLYLSPYTTTRDLRIGVIQGNIDQDKKWDEGYKDETIEIYRRLTTEVLTEDNSIDLIVWPEAATPFFFEIEKRYRGKINRFVRREGIYLLFGSPYIRRSQKEALLFNSAYLLSPSGDIASRYDKIHLVPFGEYVPLSSLLFFVNKMVTVIGDFSTGDDYTIMEIPDARFGVVICFEVIFPELVRRFVKNGAEFMTTITNDAWFGESSAPYQHFSMVVFRAIENRVPFVRAANTGISGFIDIYGRIIRSTDIFIEAGISNDIKIPERSDMNEMTFYTRYGDIFAYICVIIGIVMLTARRLSGAGLILMKSRIQKSEARRKIE